MAAWIVTIAALILATTAGSAPAQPVKCAGYLKASKQIQAEMAGLSANTGDKAMDAQMTVLIAKMRNYCMKNPDADLTKAIEETLS